MVPVFCETRSVSITVQLLCVILTSWTAPRKVQFKWITVLHSQVGLRHCTIVPSAGQKFPAVSKNFWGTWAIFWKAYCSPGHWIFTTFFFLLFCREKKYHQVELPLLEVKMKGWQCWYLRDTKGHQETPSQPAWPHWRAFLHGWLIPKAKRRPLNNNQWL